MAPENSAGEAVLILSFGFAALFVAAGVVAELAFETALALAFVERFSSPELHAATNISVKDISANPEISFRGNICAPFESNCLVGGVAGL